MKIANNYFQNVKAKLEEAIQERLSETTEQAPESKSNTDQTTTQTTANSQAAKLKTAAEESLSRIRIENEIGKNINSSKLNNMKDLVKEIAPEIKKNQLDRLIGSHVNSESAKGVMDGIRGLAGGRDHLSELTGGKLDGLRLVGGSLVSDDPPASGSTEGSGTKVEKPSVKDIIINFFLGQAQGRQQPIPLPPTPPDPETGKNVWSGVTFIKDVLGVGDYNNYVNQRGGIDTNGTPNPEAPDSGPPRVITRDMLNGIAARKGSKGEPNPESDNSTGGPIDETKTSGAANGPAGQPVPDAEISSAVVTSRDISALRIRLESKFIKP
jgi:hypothetical protein